VVSQASGLANLVAGSAPSMAHGRRSPIQERNRMNKTRDVAVIVGSLRKDSLNRKVANALVELAPPGLTLSIIEIRSRRSEETGSR
jgi:hypothetical protein